MGRDFQINGECMVFVKGNGALGATPTSQNSQPGVFELGLAEDKVTISPRFNHAEIKSDSFGPNVPVETLWMMGEFLITMVLLHFDKDVLNNCIVEAMAGGGLGNAAAAGTPMGGGQNLYQPGNHYIGLHMASPVAQFPFTFNACYLADRPVDWPLGAEKSAVQVTFRSIPYQPPPQVQPTPVGQSNLRAVADGSSTLSTIPSGQSVLVATGLPTSSEMTSQGYDMGGQSTLSTFKLGAGDFTEEQGGGGDF